MRLAEVELRRVALPLVAPFRTSFGEETTRDVLLVRVPRDVESLRASDPAAASRWRHAVREVLGGLLAEGAAVAGFARPGCYVVRKADG